MTLQKIIWKNNKGNSNNTKLPHRLTHITIAVDKSKSRHQLNKPLKQIYQKTNTMTISWHPKASHKKVKQKLGLNRGESGLHLPDSTRLYPHLFHKKAYQTNSYTGVHYLRPRHSVADVVNGGKCGKLGYSLPRPQRYGSNATCLSERRCNYVCSSIAFCLHTEDFFTGLFDCNVLYLIVFFEFGLSIILYEFWFFNWILGILHRFFNVIKFC